jgi:hypothetical protein
MDQQERIERAAALDQKQSGALPPSVEEHESGHVLGGIEAARIILVALAATAVCSRVWEPFPRVSCMSSEPFGQVSDGFKREFGPSELKFRLQFDGAACDVARWS